MENPENQRLKEFRKSLNLTQSELTDRLGIAQGSYSDVERGRKSISFHLLKKLVEIYDLNPDWIITGDGNMTRSPEAVNAYLNAYPNAYLMGEPPLEYKKKSTNFGVPAVVTVNTAGDAVIPIVDARASAGLPLLIQDESYYRDLPTMSLPWPMYRLGTWICIQVTGGSMKEVIQSMDYVIAQQVTEIHKLRIGEVYVVVTQDGVLCKRLAGQTKTHLHLKSDNERYGDYEQSLQEVLQIWHARSVIKMDTDSIQAGMAYDAILGTLDRITQRLTSLEQAK